MPILHRWLLPQAKHVALVVAICLPRGTSVIGSTNSMSLTLEMPPCLLVFLWYFPPLFSRSRCRSLRNGVTSIRIVLWLCGSASVTHRRQMPLRPQSPPHFSSTSPLGIFQPWLRQNSAIPSQNCLNMGVRQAICTARVVRCSTTSDKRVLNTFLLF